MIECGCNHKKGIYFNNTVSRQIAVGKQRAEWLCNSSGRLLATCALCVRTIDLLREQCIMRLQAACGRTASDTDINVTQYTSNFGVGDGRSPDACSINHPHRS